MSYPDPNNPYAKQPQQGQPDQPPQQGQQPGYGYPQQQGGLPSYGGSAEQGYPAAAGYGAPTTMPGTVNAARILLFVTGGLSAIGAVLMFLAAAAIGSLDADSPELQGSNADFAMIEDLGTGVVVLMGVLFLAFAVGGILLGAKVGKGGNGVRTGIIVYGAVTIVVGLLNALSLVGLVFVILAVLFIVFVAKADGKAWFNRPRS